MKLTYEFPITVRVTPPDDTFTADDALYWVTDAVAQFGVRPVSYKLPLTLPRRVIDELPLTFPNLFGGEPDVIVSRQGDHDYLIVNDEAFRLQIVDARAVLTDGHGYEWPVGHLDS